MRKKINILLSFLIAFNIFSFAFSPRPVHAVAFVDDVVLAGGVTVSTGALVALAGSTLIAGGVYLDATLNDGDISKYIVNKMIATGNAMEYWGVKTLENGKQFLTWTANGIQSFWDTLTDINDTGYTNADSEGYTHFSLNKSVGSDRVTLFTPTSGEIEVITSAGYTYRVHCNNYTDKVVGYCFTEGQFCIGFYRIGQTSGWAGSRFIGRDIDSIKVKCKDSSICVDTPQKYKDVDFGKVQDVIGSTSSGSYQPSVGIPLHSNDGVMSPSIDFPYGKSWDELFPDISVPADDSVVGNPDISIPVEGSTTGTIETTGTGSWVLNIPILGDILKVLLNILSFLKNLISSLISALIEMFKAIVVPDVDALKSEFISFKDNVSNIFHIPDTLDISKNANAPVCVYTFVVLGVSVVLDFSFLLSDDVISFIHIVVAGLSLFLLSWYNYSKIYTLLRGHAPFTGNMSTTGNSSNVSQDNNSK